MIYDLGLFINIDFWGEFFIKRNSSDQRFIFYYSSSSFPSDPCLRTNLILSHNSLIFQKNFPSKIFWNRNNIPRRNKPVYELKNGFFSWPRLLKISKVNRNDPLVLRSFSKYGLTLNIFWKYRYLYKTLKWSMDIS